MKKILFIVFWASCSFGMEVPNLFKDVEDFWVGGIDPEQVGRVRALCLIVTKKRYSGNTWDWSRKKLNEKDADILSNLNG